MSTSARSRSRSRVASASRGRSSSITRGHSQSSRSQSLKARLGGGSRSRASSTRRSSRSRQNASRPRRTPTGSTSNRRSTRSRSLSAKRAADSRKSEDRAIRMNNTDQMEIPVSIGRDVVDIGSACSESRTDNPLVPTISQLERLTGSRHAHKASACAEARDLFGVGTALSDFKIDDGDLISRRSSTPPIHGGSSPIVEQYVQNALRAGLSVEDIRALTTFQEQLKGLDGRVIEFAGLLSSFNSTAGYTTLYNDTLKYFDKEPLRETPVDIGLSLSREGNDGKVIFRGIMHEVASKLGLNLSAVPESSDPQVGFFKFTKRGALYFMEAASDVISRMNSLWNVFEKNFRPDGIWPGKLLPLTSLSDLSLIGSRKPRARQQLTTYDITEITQYLQYTVNLFFMRYGILIVLDNMYHIDNRTEFFGVSPAQSFGSEYITTKALELFETNFQGVWNENSPDTLPIRRKLHAADYSIELTNRLGSWRIDLKNFAATEGHMLNTLRSLVRIADGEISSSTVGDLTMALVDT